MDPGDHFGVSCGRDRKKVKKKFICKLRFFLRFSFFEVFVFFFLGSSLRHEMIYYSPSTFSPFEGKVGDFG